MAIKRTFGRVLGCGFSLHVGKADEDEFLDASGQGRVYEVPGIAGVGLGKELFRTRREEDAGKMDDAVGVLAGFYEGRGLGEVGAVDGDVGGRGDISGRFVAVDEKFEMMLGVIN